MFDEYRKGCLLESMHSQYRAVECGEGARRPTDSAETPNEQLLFPIESLKNIDATVLYLLSIRNNCAG